MLGNSKLVAFVLTADATRARAFYEGTLGLRYVREDGFAVVFDAHGTMLRVGIVKQVNAASHTVLGWEVDDIAAVARQLQQAGVKLKHYGFPTQDAAGIWTTPDGSRVAWFEDPDGNTLSVTQHRAN